MADQYQLLNIELECEAVALADEGDHFRQFASAPLFNRPPVNFDFARVRKEAANGLQQGRLAAPVRTNHSDPLTRAGMDVYVAENGSSTEVDTESCYRKQ